MAIPNISQIINNAITFIQSKIPGLSLLSGSVARDVVVEAPAQEFNNTYTELARIERMQVLNDPTAFQSGELDQLASSVGLTRRPGQAAVGTITFRLGTFSSSSADIGIPAGTQVSTVVTATNNNVVTFATTTPVTFVAVNANSYFNPISGFYEITAPIEATATGTAGNVGVGAITSLISSIAGTPSVYNYLATSGGTTAESDTALLGRITTLLAGTNVGTKNGILSLVNANANVVASLLVGPDDPNLVRDEFGNAADVFIIGEVSSVITETQTFTAGITTYALFQQPLLQSAVLQNTAVNAIITGASAGVGFNFIEGTHFVVNVDNNSLTRNTINSRSSITFLGSPFPDAGTPFTITYSINSLIPTLQSILSSDSNKIVGSDVQIREAVEVLIRVAATISVFPGFTKIDVAATAATNVENYLNSLTLGSVVTESEIIAIIQDTTGVQSVNVPITLEYKRPTDTSFTTANTIVINETEFGRPDTSAGAIQIT